MPRPPKKDGNGTWTARQLELDDVTKEMLLDCLCFDPIETETETETETKEIDEVLGKVEILLGSYPGGVEATKRMPGAVARGRPSLEYRRHVISKLRTIFKRYYKGDKNSNRGSQGNLSPWEFEEAVFVKIALNAAEIECPKNVRRVLHALGTPGPDRRIVMDKIYGRKGKRSQKKSQNQIENTFTPIDPTNSP